MTRDEIANMPAGREMDDLIGKHIMGWTEIRSVAGIPPDKWLTDIHWNHKPEKPRVELYKQEWKFSEDIKAAWMVVEKMTWFDLYRYEGSWSCMYENGQFVDSVDADTAPLAICRAALLAVMENK